MLAEVERRRQRGGPVGMWPARTHRTLQRLRTPVHDVLSGTECGQRGFVAVDSLLAQAMHATGKAFWGWRRREWLAVLQQDTHGYQRRLLAVAYLLSGQRDLHLEVRGLRRDRLAAKVSAGTAASFEAQVERTRP